MIKTLSESTMPRVPNGGRENTPTPKSMSQRALILQHLANGNTITQAEAAALFNCWQLGSVILRLRRSGYNIISHDERNVHNKGIHTRYELVGGYDK